MDDISKINTPKVVPGNVEEISNHESSHSDKWSSFRFSQLSSLTSKHCHYCCAKIFSMKMLYIVVLLTLVVISTISMGVAHQVNLKNFSNSITEYQGGDDQSIANNLQIFVQNVEKTVELSNIYFTRELGTISQATMQRYTWTQLRNLHRFNVHTVVLCEEQIPNCIGYTKFGNVFHMLRNWRSINNLENEIGIFPIDLKTGLNTTNTPIAILSSKNYLNFVTRLKNYNSSAPYLDIQSENFSIHLKTHLHSFVGIVSVSFTKETLSDALKIPFGSFLM